MISKKEKFTSDDFSNIKTQKPNKIYTDIGVFCIYKLPTKGSKFAIVLTKKRFKTAVLRNKQKRLFFASIKELSKNIVGHQVIFYPNSLFTKDTIDQVLQKHAII